MKVTKKNEEVENKREKKGSILIPFCASPPPLSFFPQIFILNKMQPYNEEVDFLEN